MFTLILFAVSSVVFLATLIFGGLWITLTDIYLPLGAKLVEFWLFVALFALEAVLLISVLKRLFGRLFGKRVYLRILALICSVALTFIIISIPFSPITTELMYRINQDRREEFVENFDKDELEQIDVGTYYVGDIRLSYNGAVRVAENGDSLKIMFLINKNLSGSHHVLIYSSDGTEPTEDEFYGFTLMEYGPVFSNIEKCDGNWYMVTVK